jgi:hypothetical protein
MKRTKRFISPVTGKPYRYYADMILHTDLAIKEMTAKKRNLIKIKTK